MSSQYTYMEPVAQPINRLSAREWEHVDVLRRKLSMLSAKHDRALEAEQTQLEKKDARIAELERLLDTSSNNLEESTVENASLMARIVKLEDKVSEQKRLIDTTSAKAEQLSNHNRGYRAHVLELGKQLVDQEMAFDTSSEELREQLRSQESESYTKIADLESQVQEQNNALDTNSRMQQHVGMLSAQVAQLRARNQFLEDTADYVVLSLDDTHYGTVEEHHQYISDSA